MDAALLSKLIFHISSLSSLTHAAPLMPVEQMDSLLRMHRAYTTMCEASEKTQASKVAAKPALNDTPLSMVGKLDLMFIAERTGKVQIKDGLSHPPQIAQAKLQPALPAVNKLNLFDDYDEPLPIKSSTLQPSQVSNFSANSKQLNMNFSHPPQNELQGNRNDNNLLGLDPLFSDVRQPQIALGVNASFPASLKNPLLGSNMKAKASDNLLDISTKLIGSGLPYGAQQATSPLLSIPITSNQVIDPFGKSTFNGSNEEKVSTVLPKVIWLNAAQGNGFEIKGTCNPIVIQVLRKSKRVFMDLTLTNRSLQNMMDFALMINKNA